MGNFKLLKKILSELDFIHFGIWKKPRNTQNYVEATKLLQIPPFPCPKKMQ